MLTISTPTCMKKFTCFFCARFLVLQALDHLAFPIWSHTSLPPNPQHHPVLNAFFQAQLVFPTSRAAPAPLFSFLSHQTSPVCLENPGQPHMSEVSSTGSDLPALLITTAWPWEKGCCQHWLRSKKPGRDPHPAAKISDESPKLTAELTHELTSSPDLSDHLRCAQLLTWGNSLKARVHSLFHLLPVL